jgi:hypothetical protein
MDIKVKGTSKVGILAYDLQDPYEKQNYMLTLKLTNIQAALQEFTNSLRNIRKYDSIKELPEINLDADSSSIILDAEHYYSKLFYDCLQNEDVLDVLD